MASVQAGTTAAGIIPESFSCIASLRCYSVETARFVEQELKRLLDGYQTAYQIEYSYTFKYGYVPVHNHPAAAEAILKAADKVGLRII